MKCVAGRGGTAVRSLVFSMLALAILTSCATNDVDSALQAAKAKASIDSLWTQYAVASDQRDSAAFANLFTDDASLVFSNAPTVRGRKAIGDFLGSLYTGVDATGFRVVPEELKASGSLAVQSGTFEEQFIEVESQKTEYGRYVLFAERGPNETWRIRRLLAIADSTR